MQPILPEIEAQGFKWFIITQGAQEDLEFLAPTGFGVLVDAESKASGAYGVEAIPQTFFIDRQGVIDSATLGWGEGSLQVALETVRRLTGR